MRTVNPMLVAVAVALALLPALASAKPPEPKGTLVYEDDFSDAANSDFEDNLRATDFSRGFHAPGVYHLKLAKPEAATYWTLLPGHSYGESSLVLDVWDDSDTLQGDVSLGVVFRARDNTHFYSIFLNPRKGQYTVRKLNGSQWTDIVPVTASPLIKRQTEVNQLRVDSSGDDFTIYVNGETLSTFSDASYAKGQIGLIFSNVDAVEPHMHFDNLSLYTTEPAAPAAAGPASLPNTGGAEGSAALLLAALAALLLASGGLARRVAR